MSANTCEQVNDDPKTGAKKLAENQAEEEGQRPSVKFSAPIVEH